MKNSFTRPQGKQALNGFKCLIAMLFISATALAQPGQKWATGGNANGAGEFLGTTNNFSLDFKTNNTLKMVLGTDGTLKLINLAGNGTRMLQTDATGKITAFPAGNATDVLYGNGTWGSLPVTPTSWNIVGNNIVAVNTGNVGIGTNNPQYKLHVVGDAYISNNLFVGGGIIVTDQLKAAEYVTTGRLTADTIKMGLGRVIDGTTKVAGDLYIDPTRTLTAGGDIMANSKLTVAGNATFNGVLKVAPLAGTTDRLLYVDPLGNLKTSASTAAAGPFWETIGNGGSDPTINFLGTTDANDLVIKTNSAERLRIMVNGDFNFSAHDVIFPGVIFKKYPAINTSYNIHVGIGTTDPMRAFHIYTEHIGFVVPDPDPTMLTGTHNGMRLEDVTGTNLQLVKTIWDILPNNKHLLFSKGDPTDPHILNVKMIIADNGNVGIGNTAPQAKLDVTGNALFSGKVGIGTNAPTAKLEILETAVNQFGLVVGDLTGKSLMVVPNLSTAGYNPLSNNADVGIIFRNQNGNAGNAGLTIAPHSAVNSGIRIAPDGNVGIGTSAPAYKLDVAGTIRMQEGKVCMSGCDFVFEPTYGLLSLEKRRKNVLQNKHLPNIKPAKDMEANGASIGETASGLLQNLEEHELYLYEQAEKLKEVFIRIEKIEKENEALKLENKELRKAIEKK